MEESIKPVITMGATITIGALKRRCMHARKIHGSRYCTMPELKRDGGMAVVTVRPEGKALPYEVAVNFKHQVIWRREFGGQWLQVKEIPLDI